MTTSAASDIESHIRDIPDFPAPGVVFKDITPLLAHGPALRTCIESMTSPFAADGIDKVIGVEARGFILAAPIAAALGVGFVPVRKPGKLPWKVEHQEYALEYGTDRLEIHSDAVAPGERVLIVDDVMATGGTAVAATSLVERIGGEVVGLSFLLELTFLGGRDLLPGRRISTVLSY